MQSYIDTFFNAYCGYAKYLWNDITHPSWHSYFYWLVGISLVFFLLEIIIPWRKNQKIPRKDFWLDGFYMFFNYFLFSLIIYNAASEVVVRFFNNSILSISGFDMQASNPMHDLPFWAILIIGFVVRDFVQWGVHNLLHRNEKLWQFHKVHHSVQEMGFAAHLRYHWMETIVYRTIEYIPLALLGIGLYDFFIIHLFTTAWGHYNHANISINKRYTGMILAVLIALACLVGMADITFLAEASMGIRIAIFAGMLLFGYFALGPLMPYLFNSPELHIWHHAKALPNDRHFGANFAITLAVWDYLFGTAYLPYEGRDIALGFDNVETFPQSFAGQSVYGILHQE